MIKGRKSYRGDNLRNIENVFYWGDYHVLF